MVSLPFRAADLADEMRAFAASIEEAKPRWLYCLDRVKRVSVWKGQQYPSYSQAAAKICERILGAGTYVSLPRFSKLEELGYEEANAKSRTFNGRPAYGVGPLEAWHIGHVYFARVESHPHVLKIGFSRRVRDRLEDIESEAKTKLVVRSGHLKVGTMADERWWHDDCAKFKIDGEWFFDPKSSDRTLPHFLAAKAEAA